MEQEAILRKPQSQARSEHESSRSPAKNPSSLPPTSIKEIEKPGHTRTRIRLLKYEDLPEWYQDIHIRTGYRPVSNSVKACLSSIFSMHNETLNILTHLIPAIILICIFAELQRLMKVYLPEATFIDRTIFNVNLLAAFTTAVLSSSYHTFMNHSQFISEVSLKIDYAGILILIQASFISGIYYGFYRHPKIQKLYWSMITILSLTACILTLHPKLQGLAYRPIRTLVFVLTALSGLAPVLHGIIAYGFEEALIYSGMQYWLSEGVAYGIGAFFFATRIPESLSSKGKFDIFFSSHQIFHIFVVVGAVVHLYGVWVTWKANVGAAGMGQLEI